MVAMLSADGREIYRGVHQPYAIRLPLQDVAGLLPAISEWGPIWTRLLGLGLPSDTIRLFIHFHTKETRISKVTS